MTTDFRMLAKKYISGLTPYVPGKPITELERELGITSAIKLASNENALGASQRAIRAATQALMDSHIYPDGSCFALKNALSDHLKVNSAQITIGNGSENILELIIKSYLGPNENAVISQYAFITISILIKSYGAEEITVPATDYGHDVKKMIAAVNDRTRIVFIVNPNNPTGTYLTHDEIELLLKSIPPHVLVVIDEAYYEFCNKKDYPDTLKLMKTYPNLIVTRTFSKIYGLAALRLGYAISSEIIADILNRARLPFNSNAIATAAALESLKDSEHVAQSLAMNDSGMQQMIEEFNQLKLEYIPSLGNFLTVNVATNAVDIYQKLLHKGIIVRPLGAYGMPTHLRITIATQEQNARCLNALYEIKREQ